MQFQYLGIVSKSLLRILKLKKNAIIILLYHYYNSIIPKFTSIEIQTPKTTTFSNRT